MDWCTKEIDEALDRVNESIRNYNRADGRYVWLDNLTFFEYDAIEMFVDNEITPTYGRHQNEVLVNYLWYCLREWSGDYDNLEALKNILFILEQF